LINQIGDLPHSLVLVLDDYHLVSAEPVHQAVAFLLEHLPHQMHLIIASRADPPLPIARLRGRGQLTELRQEDLRFSLDEATSFLNTIMGLGLSASDVASLTSRTEGWITGLQMAALALQPLTAQQAAVPDPQQSAAQIANFVQAFTGSNRFVLDYLVEEVLHGQPQSLQSFLLRTAILDRLTGPLCDALLEVGEHGLAIDSDEAQLTLSSTESASQRTLEQLEAANLFIVPLDNERRWYRYHRLFADLLRKRLRHLHREEVPILHRRASTWYEQNDLLPQAINHALAAEDFERAADLIERVAEEVLMRSEVATFQRWVETLPSELVQARPSLCLLHAWALVWSGEPKEVIESLLQDIDDEGVAVISSRLAPLRAFVATWQGRVARAADLARQALEQLPEDESFVRSTAAWNLGISYLLRGDIQAGSQVLDEMVRTGQRAGNVMMAVSALCHLAEIQMSGARLYEAGEIYRQALDLAADGQGQPLPISGMALIGLGELSREWNDLETAEQYVTEGIERLQEWGEFPALDGHLSLARIKQAQGDAEMARDVLDRARQIAAQFEVTELDDLLVETYQVRLWIAQGECEAAQRWIEAQGLSLDDALSAAKEPAQKPWTDGSRFGLADDDVYLDYQMRNYLYLLLARILVSQDRPSEALPLLESQATLLEQQGRGTSRRMIELQNLTALALQAQGKIDQALAALDQALTIAEQGGYVRTFVDEGEQMTRLLRLAATHGIAPEYVSKLLAAFDLPVPRYAGMLPAEPEASPAGTQPLIEPLTERELEVLRLLATGLSNPDIAQRLYIATSTVRSHLKSIYGKLDVHRRWDAVQRAEELGLL
jgi:LuxR family maltose regulon positive regulatory protein